MLRGGGLAPGARLRRVTMEVSMKEKITLTTDFENDLRCAALPFSDYPRPQRKRDAYLCLNGPWDFRIENRGRVRLAGTVTVPFAPESRLSGIGCEIGKYDAMIYERSFALTSDMLGGRVLLHFGACDQLARVSVNGMSVGEHVGGYLPFSFDVTEAVREGENTLRVEAEDPLDKTLPYGKQSKKSHGMWYTKISGIWQTVWLEWVPQNYIRDLRVTPDLCGVTVEVEGGVEEKTLIFEGKRYPFRGNRYRLDVHDPILWTPDAPHLYAFAIECGEDRVESYFGLRTFGVEERGDRAYLCLNGEPIFCHGLLDQGYFADGIFLPASPRGYEEDILRMKACGFRMLRKHIKLEPDLFYYYCDVHGMLVFQDMINSGAYHFLVDTALPTVGPRRGITHAASKKRRAAFEQTARGMIDALYNHPSVVYYTIFNEGWGQFDAKGQYALYKALDPTRVYDTTSGWFKTDATDVESDHVYFKKIRLLPVKGRPMVLSEFGGYACPIEGHRYNTEKVYGYRICKDVQSFENDLVALYENEIVPAIGEGLCAAVLTQVSDVEDETNGLMTYDRRVMKVDSERMTALAKSLDKIFYHTVS